MVERNRLAVLCILICSALSAKGAESSPSRPGPVREPFPGAPLLISAPLSDLPYGLRGGFESPSMRQSLLWHAGASQLGTQSIVWLWDGMRPGIGQGIGTWVSLIAFNYLSLYMPLGEAWLHEEWHRAVLTRRGKPSYNGVYHWDVGGSMIAVDHVSDADLADVKARHPADFTRLMSAGLESGTESSRLMRSNNFFLGHQSGYDAIEWWSTGLNGTLYLFACATDERDGELQRANLREPGQSQRDFTGFDFRAWVHDMRHPEEAYEDGPRGRSHPLGNGFDRYLLFSDLSAGEVSYLKLQTGLSLLNFVSPQYFGRDWLPGKNPWTGGGFLWNFGLTHHLTPFGYAVGGDYLARSGIWSLAFTAQGFVNGQTVLPGLGAEVFRYPASVGTTPVYLTFGATAWMQPEDQAYRTSSPEAGGAVKVGAAVPLRWSLEIFGEADAKTPGFMAGNVYLEAAVQARAGLQFKL
jgi:hypothetical protein